MTVPGTVMLRRFGSVTAFALWCCTGKAVNMRVLVSVVAKHDMPLVGIRLTDDAI